MLIPKVEALTKETKSATANSQNIALLQASTIPDLTAGVGGAEVKVDGDALEPAIGPSGTLVDLDIPDASQISLYTVRKGDNLAAIAKIYGVTPETISWANELSRGQALKEGQTLVILPISGVRYEVKKGDTLKSIANKFSGDADEISRYNNLDVDGSLALGDIVIIPDGEMQFIVTASSGKTGKRQERLLGTNGAEIAGYFIRPISGGRMSQNLHGFNGIDLAAPRGTPIMASASGTVIVSRSGGWGGGYGNYVVVAHPNGVETLYAHNTKNLVSVGEQVSQGQTIALVGSTGRSTGPHVHFEVRGAKNPGRDNTWAAR